jgi:hypothetical protein
MTTYRAGFSGTGKVIHLAIHQTAVCFDSRQGRQRTIYKSQAVSENGFEALAKAVEITGARACQVCESTVS